MFTRTQATALFLLLAAIPTHADAEPLLPLTDGQRILFLGNGYVENDQAYAFFEARLQRRFAGRGVTFRYMGWSGDTVRGSARTSGYQEPEGFARLDKETRAFKPSVIFLAYGMNESFGGAQSLPNFLRDYEHLLATLAPLNARLVILSPPYHEDLGRPYPDPAAHNQVLQQYANALKDFAHARKHLFIDLFHPLETAKRAEPNVRLTTNGLLLTRAGYAVTARATEEQLGLPPRRWQVHMDWTGKVVAAEGAKLKALPSTATALRFEAIDMLLPVAKSGEANTLRITGLTPGSYRLRVDGQDILHASAAQWGKGVNIAKGPPFNDAEKLRAVLVLRNQTFYRRWRPYNDHSRHWTYIDIDFKLYDQEIAKEEQRIAELRMPRAHVYEITAMVSTK
jgi:lysophospholipase L1-like esterase